MTCLTLRIGRVAAETEAAPVTPSDVQETQYCADSSSVGYDAPSWGYLHIPSFRLHSPRRPRRYSEPTIVGRPTSRQETFSWPTGWSSSVSRSWRANETGSRSSDSRYAIGVVIQWRTWLTFTPSSLIKSRARSSDHTNFNLTSFANHPRLHHRRRVKRTCRFPQVVAYVVAWHVTRGVRFDLRGTSRGWRANSIQAESWSLPSPPCHCRRSMNARACSRRWTQPDLVMETCCGGVPVSLCRRVQAVACGSPLVLILGRFAFVGIRANTCSSIV